MRPDRSFVEAADFNPEQGLRLAGKLLSCAEFIGIKIDVPTIGPD
jgi:hypothetical protein